MGGSKNYIVCKLDHQYCLLSTYWIVQMEVLVGHKREHQRTGEMSKGKSSNNNHHRRRHHDT